MSDHPGNPGPASGPAVTDPTGKPRELWGTRIGFIMAAVGSAIGLGNMWRFSYTTAEHGGAAFVLLYILLTLIIGIPVMIAEFGIGRSARLSPIGALRKVGGRGWAPLGYLFVLTGFLILAYYSVIAGWVVRYAVDALRSPFPADAGGYFGEIATGPDAVAFHLVFMALTIFIVMGGVKKGIERASLLMMPLLVIIVAGLAVFAATLDGAGEGYRFYLTPSVEELLSLETLGAAAGQAFFSLSLGMGAMLTYASYLSRESSLPNESATIAFSDFGIAFVAGLVVFPVIFALGLQQQVGESTVGALFIALPGAFEAMGAVGRVVGILFFTALFIGAITSAVSLLEVVTSSVIDEFKLSRKAAALGAGGLIAALGILPALDLVWLDVFDSLTGNVFLPLGGLAIAILVGWRLPNAVDMVARGASASMANMLRGWRWTLAFIVPPLLVLVLWNTSQAAWATFAGIFGGGS
ncbi:MAG TPA: sodium-dependent transporter [Longimicrobiales bacterium]|nr:sodium-dependent transporter [Longimicrobiales bacterium]